MNKREKKNFLTKFFLDNEQERQKNFLTKFFSSQRCMTIKQLYNNNVLKLEKKIFSRQNFYDNEQERKIFS